MSPHAIQFDEAAQALLFITAFWRGWLPIRLASWGHHEFCWRRGPSDDLAGLIRHLDTHYDSTIELGLPRERIPSSPEADGVGRASILWARVEGREQLRRAARFRPLPSLVLQEGTSTRRWLMWAMREPLGYFDVVEKNRRLAYCFGATQKDGDPDLAWIPAPGTMIREGRSRPVAVRVTRLSLETFDGRMTDRLREPPAKDAWLKGAA